MSDQKKDPKASAGVRQMFGGGRQNIRDVVPTEAEGDALLDMLFDDAPPRSTPTPSENPNNAEPAPTDDGSEDDQPTRIHSGDEPEPARDVRRSPAGGAVAVSPPGWNISPSPARAGAPRPAAPPPAVPPPRPTPRGGEDDDSGDVRTRIATLSEDDVEGEADLTEVGALPDVDDASIDVDRASFDAAGYEEHEEAVAIAAQEPVRRSSMPPPWPTSPSDRPLSRAPAPGDAAFTDERDASIVLGASPELRESYLERARWLRAEAGLMESKAARARTLLIASELFAMVGEDDDAFAIATEIHELSAGVALGTRQHRTLLAQRGQWPAALDVMDAEARFMPTPESKCHVSWFGAEVARLVQNDDASARKRSDVAMRAMPSDPRPHVQRFAELLRPRGGPPPGGTMDPAELLRLRPASGQGNTELADAFGRVAALRGDTSHTGGHRSSYEAVLTARSALQREDVGAAVAALQSFDGGVLHAPAGWLGGMLAQVSPGTRPLAESLFQAAATGSHGVQAQKALAAVAIEAGGAIDVGQAPEAFSEGDRIAIAALSGKVSSIDDGGIAEERELEVLKSASRAVSLARNADRLRELEQGGVDAPAIALGRALAAEKHHGPYASGPLPAELARALESFASEERNPGVLRGLGLEIDVDAGSVEKVVGALVSGAHDASEDTADASSVLAAAVVAEVGGDREKATELYERASELAPPSEALLRAVLVDRDGADIARALVQHAEGLPQGARRLALLVEAAIRLHAAAKATAQGDEKGPASEDNEATAALRSATEGDAPVSLASYLAAQIAREGGDQERLIEWLRIGREASDDATERAYDLVREALLVSEAEPAHAGALIEEALKSHPKDIGLRDLYERVLGESAAGRATFREARAREASGPAAARLAIEAALFYEQEGDTESAARAAKLAEEAGDTEFAPIFAYRYALLGFGASELVDALLPKARATENPAERLETYERLAELDERGRGDMSSSLLFRRTILEENPTHLRTLRRVASSLMAQGREDELEPIALDLAKSLDGPEAHAYAALSARLRSRGKWEDTLEPVKVAYAQLPRTAWALRQMAAHARAAGDERIAAASDQELVSRTDRAPERATLALRAAESFQAAGNMDSARELFELSVGAAPTHPLAHLGFAGLLEKVGDAEAAAHELEAAADLISTPAWKAEIDYRAGVLYEDKLHDADKARGAFERVFVLDPKNDDVFARLRKLYVSAGARGELAELLERRLDSVDDPAERVEMEVMRGRALAEVGDAGAAKRALLAALESNPDHVDALSAFADLALTDEDFQGAEQALIRLARLTGDADTQATIYMRLGDLYDVHLPNADRAELAYQEILKRKPDDVPAREKLIGLYVRTANFARAVEEQNALVEAAATPEQKCQRTVELADILEQMGDTKKAETTLVAARKAYPKSDLALRALVQFYQRTNQGPSAAIILDRSVADARRALSTGRFEPYLFETLWTAAELRGRHDAAAVARATVQALEGEPTDLEGAGAAAANANIDDLLAPEVMTPAFRDLLLRTGGMLDQAVPFNFESIRATPFQDGGELAEEVADLSRAYGLPQLKLLVSPVLGPVCIGATAHPPVVVIGQSLANAEPSSVRTFLLHRAMKVLQANAATFARTAPIDLWPLLAAYLKVMNPSFAPQGVDAAKLNEAHARLSKTKPSGLAADVSVLAADVSGSIGNRASTLNTAVNGWGARAALLAVADPNVALSAIALASGAMNGPPTEGKDRVTWVGRNAEARDLVVFSVSDAYADARTRLGIAAT